MEVEEEEFENEKEIRLLNCIMGGGEDQKTGSARTQQDNEGT
jgi:hypothetical protein